MWKCDPKTNQYLPFSDEPNPQFVHNVVEIADALADLIYVVLYAANCYGINLEPVFEEIQRSNMTKVGGHKNEYGKLIKPPTYSPANLYLIIKSQLDTIGVIR